MKTGALFLFFHQRRLGLASHLAQKQKLHYDKLHIDHLQSIDPEPQTIKTKFRSIHSTSVLAIGRPILFLISIRPRLSIWLQEDKFVEGWMLSTITYSTI